MIETYKYFIKNFNGKGQDALSMYLRDTAYIGKYKLYRKEIYLENYIPRIMNDDLFFQVQDLLVKKEKVSKKTTKTSLFSGILYCNTCKIRMVKKTDNRVKSKLIRYSCDNSRRRKVGSMDYKCSNHHLIREDFIEKYLLNNIYDLAKKWISKNQITNSSPQKTEDNSEKIKKLNKKIEKLKDLYLDDLIDKDTYKKDLKKFQDEIEIIKKENHSDDKKDLTKVNEFINTDFSKIYPKLTLEEKRTFFLNLIDKIYIENGTVKEVVFL